MHPGADAKRRTQGLLMVLCLTEGLGLGACAGDGDAGSSSAGQGQDAAFARGSESAVSSSIGMPLRASAIAGAISSARVRRPEPYLA